MKILHYRHSIVMNENIFFQTTLNFIHLRFTETSLRLIADIL